MRRCPTSAAARCSLSGPFSVHRAMLNIQRCGYQQCKRMHAQPVGTRPPSRTSTGALQRMHYACQSKQVTVTPLRCTTNCELNVIIIIIRDRSATTTRGLFFCCCHLPDHRLSRKRARRNYFVFGNNRNRIHRNTQ